MNRIQPRFARRITCTAIVVFVTSYLCIIGCMPGSIVPLNEDPSDDPNMQPDNPDGGDQPDNPDPSDNPESNGAGGELFGAINATELLMEGVDSSGSNGSTRFREERFTADWSLTPSNPRTDQAFLNGVLVDVVRGDLSGQATLTYRESGTDFEPELDCPTSSYEGQVEWVAEVQGTFEYVPVLDEISVLAMASSVSSPEYTVAFMTPGCPEFDSMSPSQYVWQGPGQGTWGFVTIVLRNGRYENRLDNPLGNDLGEEDFYEIEVTAGGP